MPNVKTIKESIVAIDREATWNVAELDAKKKPELEAILLELEKPTATAPTPATAPTTPTTPTPPPALERPGFRVGSIIRGAEGATTVGDRKVTAPKASTGKGYLQIRDKSNLNLTDEIKRVLPRLLPPVEGESYSQELTGMQLVEAAVVQVLGYPLQNSTATLNEDGTITPGRRVVNAPLDEKWLAKYESGL